MTTSRIMLQNPFQRAGPGVIILVIHIVGAGAWWWLLPGGFPVGHPRFWSNQVLPLAMLLVGLVGLWAFRSKRHKTFLAALYVFPSGWLAAALSSRVIFPISARGWWAVLLWAVWLGSVVRRSNSLLKKGDRHLAAAQFPQSFDCSSEPVPVFSQAANPGAWFPNRASIIVAILAALTGGLVPLSQRSPLPSTTPANEPFPDVMLTADAELTQLPIMLREDVQVVPRDGSINVRCEHVSVRLQPLLTFISRSPDRCWSVLAPRADRDEVPRKFVAGHVDGSAVRLKHESDVTSLLSLVADGTKGPISIDAYNRIERPVFSHLNSFCEFEITGFKALSLVFSPCPDVAIEVTVSDYPVGRPRRLAFLDADGLFQVVEATSRGHVGRARLGYRGTYRRNLPESHSDQPLKFDRLSATHLERFTLSGG